MNRRMVVERVLWGGAALGLMIGCIRLSSPHRPVVISAMTGHLDDLPPRPTSDSLADAIGIITEGNLFRPDRKTTTAREGPGSAQGSTMSRQPPMPTRPPLTLRGIVGGPPWSVVLLGVPGRDAPMVLRQGQPDAGLELRAIRHDTAIVSARDTTWRLTMSRAW